MVWMIGRQASLCSRMLQLMHSHPTTPKASELHVFSHRAKEVQPLVQYQAPAVNVVSTADETPGNVIDALRRVLEGQEQRLAALTAQTTRAVKDQYKAWLETTEQSVLALEAQKQALVWKHARDQSQRGISQTDTSQVIHQFKKAVAPLQDALAAWKSKTLANEVHARIESYEQQKGMLNRQREYRAIMVECASQTACSQLKELAIPLSNARHLQVTTGLITDYHIVLPPELHGIVDLIVIRLPQTVQEMEAAARAMSTVEGATSLEYWMTVFRSVIASTASQAQSFEHFIVVNMRGLDLLAPRDTSLSIWSVECAADLPGATLAPMASSPACTPVSPAQQVSTGLPTTRTDARTASADALDKKHTTEPTESKTTSPSTSSAICSPAPSATTQPVPITNETTDRTTASTGPLGLQDWVTVLTSQLNESA